MLQFSVTFNEWNKFHRNKIQVLITFLLYPCTCKKKKTVRVKLWKPMHNNLALSLGNIPCVTNAISRNAERARCDETPNKQTKERREILETADKKRDPAASLRYRAISRDMDQRTRGRRISRFFFFFCQRHSRNRSLLGASNSRFFAPRR